MRQEALQRHSSRTSRRSTGQGPRHRRPDPGGLHDGLLLEDGRREGRQLRGGQGPRGLQERHRVRRPGRPRQTQPQTQHTYQAVPHGQDPRRQAVRRGLAHRPDRAEPYTDYACPGWHCDWTNPKHPGVTKACCWLVVPVVFFSISQSKLPGYILPAIPAGAVLLADYLLRRLEREQPVSKWLAIVHAIVASAPVVPAMVIGFIVMKHGLPEGTPDRVRACDSFCAVRGDRTDPAEPVPSSDVAVRHADSRGARGCTAATPRTKSVRW